MTWPLNMPILSFKDDQKDNIFDINRLCESFAIFGGVGSGKTSGSAKYIAKSLLNKQFGGTVLTAKTEELNNWRKLCEDSGRLDDLVIFEVGSGLCFDPLMYLSMLPGGNASNITNLLIELSQMTSRVSGGGGTDSSDPFWTEAPKRLIRNAIVLLKASKQDVSIENIDKLIRESSIDSLDQTPLNNFYLFCAKEGAIYSLSSMDKRAYKHAINYFSHDLRTMPEKTKGSVLEIWNTIAEPFFNDILAEYFCGAVSPSLQPEMCFEQGKIILINFPVKEYLEAGAMAQMIYKRIFQIAVERRSIVENDRPIFQYIDEAHFFISEYDSLFLTTSRSKRCCSIYITQNISNYYSSMGGHNITAKINSILGAINTKIMHNSVDAVSCEYYSKLIGKQYERIDDYDPQSQTTRFSWRYANIIEPTEFGKLKTGENLLVEAYIHSKGLWSNGKSILKVTFKQKF